MQIQVQVECSSLLIMFSLLSVRFFCVFFINSANNCLLLMKINHLNPFSRMAQHVYSSVACSLHIHSRRKRAEYSNWISCKITCLFPEKSFSISFTLIKQYFHFIFLFFIVHSSLLQIDDIIYFMMLNNLEWRAIMCAQHTCIQHTGKNANRLHLLLWRMSCMWESDC